MFTENTYIAAGSVGCLLSGIMMELWGRRLAVQIAVSSVCFGCLLIAVSNTYELSLIGIVVYFCGTGASFPGIFVSKKHRNTRNMVKM